jgi:hypothetical protein
LKKVRKIKSIFDQQALDESYNNAEGAKTNAQEAQEKYADQASKVKNEKNSHVSFALKNFSIS